VQLFNEFKKTLPQHKTETSSPQIIPPLSASPGKLAKKLNEGLLEANITTQKIPPARKGYNYFLSYAHVHSKEVQLFVDELKKRNTNLSIFYDKDSIPPGGLWIQQISAAIQQADKVLIFLSPEYDKSPVCWDEFQCAKLMEYNRKKSIIQTVYLYGHKETEMPLIMGIYSYIDCREGDAEKLQQCVQQLLK